MAINDVYRLEVIVRCGPQFAECVFHAQTDQMAAVDPVLPAEDIATWGATLLRPKFLDCVADEVIWSRTRSKRVNNGGGPNLSVLDGISAGTRPGPLAISSTGPVLVWPYSTGPRFRSGRTFIPGVAQLDVADNEFAAQLLTAVDVLATELLGVVGFNTTNFFMGIFSPTTAQFFRLTSSTISGKPGQQNGRLKPVL